MKIFVTGAAGFIGSHLCDRFLTAGHEVFGIDNLQTGRLDNLPPDTDWFQKGDITTPGFAVAVAEFNPDWIIHTAASYSDRHKWHRDTNTNVQGSINVAIAARESGARVLYFQTALIYGGNPYPEFWEPWPLELDTAVKPENSYAISKYAGGQYLRHAGVPLLELRLANIYGPRNLSGPVPTFYKRISQGDRCTISGTRRDFIYIQDLVDLVAQAVDMDATGTYHVSTGRDFPIAQVYDAVIGALDAYAFPEPEFVQPAADDAATILLDPSQTQRDFSWVATTDLDEGIENAVNWYREHGVTDTYTHLEVRS